MKFFASYPVLAYISDGSINFNTLDFDKPLTPAQQEYLKAQTGQVIPQVFWRKQIHEDGVIVAQGKASSCSVCPDADAFVTNERGLPIAIRTADCVPVFIYDPKKNVIGLAHAGWKGTKVEIAAKTVQTMRDKFNCECYDLQAAIGPALRPCCYEVGREFLGYFPNDVAERNGKLYLDTIQANRRQLIQAGIKNENIEDSGICTICSPNYFSFRRDADQSGRMISVMMLL